MLHRHFVDKAEFINVTTALLTQRCTLCLLQLEHVPMQTCNSCSPSKSLCTALTVLSPRARHLSPRDWKTPRQHLWNPPNQPNLAGGKGRKSCHLLRKRCHWEKRSEAAHFLLAVSSQCSNSALPGSSMPSGHASPTGLLSPGGESTLPQEIARRLLSVLCFRNKPDFEDCKSSAKWDYCFQDSHRKGCRGGTEEPEIERVLPEKDLPNV